MLLKVTQMGNFDSAYRSTPPWDIGRPQSEFMRLEWEGKIRGRVLDVGCGTGENAIHLASIGYDVLGIDLSPAAIDKAKEKAEERESRAVFSVHDALDLPSLGQTFDTVIDSGMFHTFSDRERARFVESVARVLRPGGMYHMLSFSEREPGAFGPRRVTQQEIRDTFRDGWRVDVISPACFESNWEVLCREAWLASITRL
jgi:ubiquinone/menaquinone biosynthesis C-methylase UbiE